MILPNGRKKNFPGENRKTLGRKRNRVHVLCRGYHDEIIKEPRPEVTASYFAFNVFARVRIVVAKLYTRRTFDFVGCFWQRVVFFFHTRWFVYAYERRAENENGHWVGDEPNFIE